MLGPAEREKTLARIREICLALPETSERPSHGAPTFFVRGKRAFLMVLTNHHGDGRFAIWCAAAPGLQAMLVEADPERFFVPPYVGHRGWLGGSVSTAASTGTSSPVSPRMHTPKSRRPNWSRRLASRGTTSKGRPRESHGRPLG